MNQDHPIRGRATGQAGFSLIEVMLAILVLGIGLLGSIGMICAAAASNSGSKLNTTAATLAESTMEKIVAMPQGGAALPNLTDCKGNTFSMGTTVSNNPPDPGVIDFRQPPVPNYSMLYVMCSSGQDITYDVRWRVDPGPSPATELVTVSVKSGVSAGPVAALARPITLRTLRGN
jgi:prepilin-type N-terminal cleavage/methylation domain-containing protein